MLSVFFTRRCAASPSNGPAIAPGTCGLYNQALDSKTKALLRFRMQAELILIIKNKLWALNRTPTLGYQRFVAAKLEREKYSLTMLQEMHSHLSLP